MALFLAIGLFGHLAGAAVCWAIVNDESHNGVWANDDFRQWAGVSVVWAVLLVALIGATTRRWHATIASAMGCLLAMMLEVTVFLGYAISTSA